MPRNRTPPPSFRGKFLGVHPFFFKATQGTANVYLKWRYKQKRTTPIFKLTLPDVIGNPTSERSSSYRTSRNGIMIRWRPVWLWLTWTWTSIILHVVERWEPATSFADHSDLLQNEIIPRKEIFHIFIFLECWEMFIACAGYLDILVPNTLSSSYSSSLYGKPGTLTLSMLVIRCACLRYAVHVWDTLWLLEIHYECP